MRSFVTAENQRYALDANHTDKQVPMTSITCLMRRKVTNNKRIETKQNKLMNANHTGNKFQHAQPNFKALFGNFRLFEESFCETLQVKNAVVKV